jgi:hypothetical protein
LELSCKKSHEETSGEMEVAGVLNFFNSLHTQGICYTKYLGDGESKVYQRVLAEKPYGRKISVTKLEYLGHVQKKNGSNNLENCERKDRYKISR